MSRFVYIKSRMYLSLFLLLYISNMHAQSVSVKSLLAYYQSFRQLNNIDRYLKQSAPGDTSQDLPSSPKVTHIYCIILKNYHNMFSFLKDMRYRIILKKNTAVKYHLCCSVRAFQRAPTAQVHRTRLYQL